MIDKIIKEAKSWVGYLEKRSNAQLESFTGNAGTNNYTIFAKQYITYFGQNYQAQPWCAVFVSCVFRNALGKDVQSKIMPHFAYCPTGVNQFKKMGIWKISNPKKGDIIFFKDGTGIACHVGIVYNVDKNYVYTIEGNTSSASGVVANGGGVAQKKYSIYYNRILGYASPKYTVTNDNWQDKFLNSLVSKGYVTNRNVWSKYQEAVRNSECLALMDKITGGTWKSNEANSSIHWCHPHLISLCGKKIVNNPETWISRFDNYISKALFLALVDNATNGMVAKYKNLPTDHWGRNHLNSLCDKKIIDTPEAWSDNFEGQVNRGQCMALLCKAFKVV